MDTKYYKILFKNTLEYDTMNTVHNTSNVLLDF